MTADKKPVNALFRPLSPGKAADTAVRIIYPLLMGLAAGMLMLAALDAPIPACIGAAAVVFGLLFRFNTYKMLFFAPPAAMLIPAAVCGHLIFKFPVYLLREYYVLSRAACGVLVFGAALAFIGALLSKLDPSAADPSLFVPTLLCTAPLLFTVTVYLPTDLFLKNRTDFPFALQDMIFIPLVYFAVITLSASLGACLLGGRFNTVCRAVMLGLTLCVFVQYMFLNGSLPVMLGKQADWSTFTSQKIISLAVWIVLFGGGVFAALKFRAVPEIRLGTVLLPTLIGAFEVVMLAVSIISAGSTAFEYQMTRLTGKDQFTVSKNRNLVIFVLDEADARIFDDVRDEDPSRFDFMKDFICYDNYSTRYDSTNFSIPQMLTGTDLIPEQNIWEWYDKVFASEQHKRFFEILRSADYKSDIYGDFLIGDQYDRIADIADNMQTVTREDITVDHYGINDLMSRFSRYLYMPYLAKPSFEPAADAAKETVRTGHSSVFNNVEFLNSCTLSPAEGDENYFIFQHLGGLHYPINTENQHTEALLCLDMMDRYLSEMKRLGVYDDAMVIITGDHGIHLDYGATPAFYIKEPGHTADKMTVNTAPVYITDLFSTCLINAGLYNESEHRSLFGDSIYDHKEGEERERLWFGRDSFKIQGDKERSNTDMRNNRMYGYYFTGDRTELDRKTRNDPPDIVLEFDTFY